MTEASLVKELRERTGAGMMECKKALVETKNDIDKAIVYLREKGIAGASKKAGRVANDGRVHSYIHGTGKIGVLVEINCETDFVARNEDFVKFTNDVCMHIAAANPRYLNKEDVPGGDIEGERSILKAQAEAQGKKGPVVDKIVDGRISKFYEENCLMHQRFVKDPEKTIESLLKEQIAKMGENMSIRRFARFQLGEGLAAAPKADA